MPSGAAGKRQATTLTIGPIEVQNFKATGALLLRSPDPRVRLEGSTPAYLHTDQVNSIQLITDSAGAAAMTSTYKPFGEIKTTSSDWTPPRTAFRGCGDGVGRRGDAVRRPSAL